jgi:hypothetical protein
VKRILFYLVFVAVLMLMVATMVYAVGPDTSNIGKGVWWIITSIFAAFKAFFHFNKKYQGTTPDTVITIFTVAGVVLGMIFATPWSIPVGP